MPELPEVETIKLGLEKRIVGKTIADVEICNAKSFQGDKSKVESYKVESIKRRAKVIALELSSGYYLLFHLKMTGQLIYIDRNDKRFAGGHPDHNCLPADAKEQLLQTGHAKLPNSTTAIVFNFGDNTHLYFNDMRKFGWCKVLTDEQIEKIFNEEYGPEPFDKEFTPEYLMSRAMKIPSRKIKQFLTDQTIIAGIGNIYADESLFDARISPLRKVKDIHLSEWKKLIQSILMVLEKAIKYGGTTDSDYVDAEGKKGGMQNHLKVYHKTGLPCPAGCGGVIERITVGGRGTHFCPACQS
jgi:formamidopyrimidine-DNA glycosylase